MLTTDIWGEVKPRILEAIGVAVDAAVLFGTNAPAAWPTSLVKAAYYSQNVVTLGTGADIADDIGDENGVMAAVEEDGYEVTGFAGSVGMKAKLRGLRSSTGELIFQPSMTAGTPGTLYGEPIQYVKNGSWSVTPAAVGQAPGLYGGAHMLAGDFNQAVYAIRKDVTWKVLSEATIYDTDGTTILYRLAQEDMVALRVVIRLAWQVPNPINRLKSGEVDWDSPSQGDKRYPFSVLVPPAATS